MNQERHHQRMSLQLQKQQQRQHLQFVKNATISKDFLWVNNFETKKK